MEFKINLIVVFLFLFSFVSWNSAKVIEQRIASDVNESILHRNVRSASDSCEIEDLEKLDYSELAVKANISLQCSFLANDIFARKFASAKINIWNEFRNEPGNGLNILQHFGHLISDLGITFTEYGFQSPLLKNIFETVNENCRKSLTHLAISYVDHKRAVDVMSILQGPFEKAEYVKLHLLDTPRVSEELRLNKIFPQVRHLDISFENVSDRDFIDCEYPHLRELAVSAEISVDESFDEFFKSLLEKNPNITSVYVWQPTSRKLQYLSDFLKNLEELEYTCLFQMTKSNLENDVSFPNVKRLKVYNSFYGILPNPKIFSEKLEELDFRMKPLNDDYFNFLLSFKGIKKLRTGNDLNGSDLEKLIGAFPLLSEAEISFHEDINRDAIIEFVKQNNQLNLLRFKLSHDKDKDFKRLFQNGVGDDFRVTYIPQPININYNYIIERKVPVRNDSVSHS